MSRKIFITLVFMLCSVLGVQAQQQWKYVSRENIGFKMPENWRMLNAAKPQGDMTVTIEGPDSKSFVEIKCERYKINLKVRANDVAALRSGQPTFEYMEIDKVKATQFNGFDAQVLNYTNTYLNDVYKGFIYAFVKEGYTYTVESYGEDNPQTQNFLRQIISTVNVNSADKKENIKDQAEEFVPQGWAKEEIDNSAEIAAKEAEIVAAKAAKEAAKAKAKEEKAQQKAQKQAEKEQKDLAKKQAEFDKQQKKLEKQQIQADKARAKAEKRAAKAERKLFEKENKLKELTNRQKAIDKELNKIAKEQLKLNEDYGKAQLKDDQKKMEKIQKQQSKLANKVTSLNKERDGITKKLSVF